jgi:hypothetical protein
MIAEAAFLVAGRFGPGWPPSARVAAVYAAVVFVVAAALNLYGHVRDSELRQGLLVAPVVGSAFALGLALICACAVAATGHGRPQPLVGGAGLVCYAVTLAFAFLAVSEWAGILGGRLIDELRGDLPHSPLRFLDDAVQVAVLRRYGDGYQFRYDEVRRYLLQAPPTKARNQW